MKIAIYGGGFNPPTFGHNYVINEVFKNTNIEQIILIPDGNRKDKKFNISIKNRIKMIESFILTLEKQGLNVKLDNYFITNNLTETTTYNVDKYCIKKFNIKPWHIFGTDIIKHINKWDGNPNKYIENDLYKIFVERHNYKYNLDKFKKYKLITPKVQLDISSTKVRENIKNSKSITQFVNIEIEKYIKNKKLYI